MHTILGVQRTHVCNVNLIRRFGGLIRDLWGHASNNSSQLPHTPLTRYSVVKMHTCLRLPPNLLVHGVDVGTLLLGGKAGLGSNRGGAATKSTTRETETGVGDVHARQALTGEHTTTDVGCGGTVPPERVLGGRGLAAMAKSQALVDEVRLGSKSVLFFRGPNKTGRGDGEQ